MKSFSRLIILLLSAILLLSVSLLLVLTSQTATPNDMAGTENSNPFDPEETTGTTLPDSSADTSEAPSTITTDTLPPETTEPPVTTEPPPPVLPSLSVTDSLLAKQVFVYDVMGDSFLFEKGTDDAILPASITKILTALYALEVCPPETLFYPKDELSLVGAGSSLAYIKTNHILTLEMLIEGMLLPSGNDAAYVVAAGTARYVTGDSNMPAKEAVAYFMEQANAFAVSLGCTGTVYSVPDGLAYKNHYTSAHDLAILGKAALANPIIAKYASTVSERVVYASKHTNTWTNTNQLINPSSPHYSPYVTGLKTGSLTNHYCLFVSAEIKGRTFLIGIFGAPNTNARYRDATTLIGELEQLMNTYA